MAGNPPEIPPYTHELADQKLKQAHAACDHLTAYLNNAMGVWMGAVPPNPLTVGLRAVQDHAIDIAKENAQSAFTLAGRIANAKTPKRF